MGVAVEVIVTIAPSHSKNGRLMLFMFVEYVAGVVKRGRTLEPAESSMKRRRRSADKAENQLCQ